MYAYICHMYVQFGWHICFWEMYDNYMLNKCCIWLFSIYICSNVTSTIQNEGSVRYISNVISIFLVIYDNNLKGNLKSVYGPSGASDLYVTHMHMPLVCGIYVKCGGHIC